MALIKKEIQKEILIDNVPKIVTFNIEIDTQTGDKYGCTDPAAMNYCPTCNKDDGTCVYLANSNTSE